jgi:hypothetical protein
MFETEGRKNEIIGLGLGAVSGFLLHKNLKLSKGVSIAIGSVLGVVIGFQFTKSQAKKNRELSVKNRNAEAISEKQKMISEGIMTPSGDKGINAYKNNLSSVSFALPLTKK